MIDKLGFDEDTSSDLASLGHLPLKGKALCCRVAPPKAFPLRGRWRVAPDEVSLTNPHLHMWTEQLPLEKNGVQISNVQLEFQQVPVDNPVVIVCKYIFYIQSGIDAGQKDLVKV